MKLIISEKAIAGENIADLLSDGSVKQLSVSGAKVFEFNWKGEEVKLVPLRGHISDVEFPKKFANWRGVDVRELINPKEIIYSQKEFNIINALKEVARSADLLIIATDADREGEAIGLEAINYALSTNTKIKIKRAYFSAITKTDINKSFDSLEEFDYNFAYSANARREIDLIWGAVLTRFISIVSGQIGKDFLSVGRVQTPALALVVDKEKERLAFVKKPFWELILHCEKDSIPFDAIHSQEKFWDKKKADLIYSSPPKKAVIKKLDKKTKVIKKPVPFNTTDFLRAATAIGFSAGRAMDVAESLYQRGLTSYPRTDNSVYPSSVDLIEILNKLASVQAIRDSVKSVLAQKEIIPSKGKEAKDHPPIYPVGVAQKEGLNQDEWRIYELICRRFLATLSEDAKTENTSVLLSANNEPYVARGQIILFEGWKGVYPYSELNENILPKLSVGDEVNVLSLDLLNKETQPPNRYSQGSLIKLMEDNNLGTKSTRPSIIQKLYARKYISGNKSIEPSKVAFAVIDSLEKNCEIVTKPEMTSNIEKEMDEIAAGKKKQMDVVEKSCADLKRVMDLLFEKKDFVGLELRKALRFSEVMGVCKCGGNLVQRKGKTGKRFVGCANYPDCTVTFPLPQNGLITPLNTNCPECGAPQIQVKAKRFSYKMCLNMNCVTKKDWGKKNEKKENENSVKSVELIKNNKVINNSDDKEKGFKKIKSSGLKKVKKKSI
ncbi:MAG: DNA topoisomerase I [Candidatus ainarchaeum sp.]|jgi:DNA topoisomerase I|nr:DNA topoisomerase I [Candidatus ainarchaeum sp.]MDD4128170.1 DNA topoisomerase I [Candidatus ainarchaeum sp.]MDD4467759.1 DNA topoisomerase I [Candidatus ainarchaeum sp.]